MFGGWDVLLVLIVLHKRSSCRKVIVFHKNGSLELPYYRKLTLHEIKVLEINAT